MWSIILDQLNRLAYKLVNIANENSNDPLPQKS